MPDKEKTIDIEIQGGDEERFEESTPAPEPASDVSEPAEDTLADRLHRSREYSVDGSKVKGQIVDITEKKNVVQFEIEKLTDDTVVTDTVRIPDPWSDKSRLARILDGYGYNPSTIDMMEGEEVELTKHITGWRISDPNKKSPLRAARLATYGVLGGLTLLFVGGIAYSFVTGSIIPFLVALFVVFVLPFLVFFGFIGLVMASIKRAMP